jgi:transcriptional regulator with XRE-family HTH domain
MDAARASRTFRAIRVHLGLRQSDVAQRAGVSQQHVSDLERGRLGSMTVDEVERMFRAIDARVSIAVLWRGGELDRLLDEGHAATVGAVARRLRAAGWDVIPEATFSVYGERGSIDLLAWHAPTRTVLVVEVKTEIASAEELLRRHDVKVRLAPGIARERFGDVPLAIGRLLVVTASATNRRRVARLGPVLDRSYPLRGDAARAWLARPTGSIGALLFADTSPDGVGHRSRRPARVVAPRRTTTGGA